MRVTYPQAVANRQMARMGSTVLGYDSSRLWMVVEWAGGELGCAWSGGQMMTSDPNVTSAVIARVRHDRPRRSG
jgi:hypothetical protein